MYRHLQSGLEGCVAELECAREALRQKEQEALEGKRELHALRDASAELERRLEDKESKLGLSQTQMSNLQEQLGLANQKAEDLQAMTRQQELELARLREVLRRTEKELDERVAHLEQRCLFSEEERSRFAKNKKYGKCDGVIGGHAIHVDLLFLLFISGKTQEEGLRRVEELKVELTSLKESSREAKKSQTELTQQVTDLSEELTKEKVSFLSSLWTFS